MIGERMKKRRVFLALLTVIVMLLLALNADRGLVVDDPKKSDVILVVAGETDHRPARALELLSREYASKVVLDVPARERIYQWTEPELAERWVQSLPQAREFVICPTQGLSTKEEAHEAGRCLRPLGAHDVLLVTSDFHTRRALSTFRHELPEMRFSVAAAYDPTEFGLQWWRHREWAKNTLYEWMRLAWWCLIDRWR
jgi:uncharacterized SAM-binding protein YcdF (DUF218 family)